MKKLLAILLALALVFAFAACNGNTEETTDPTEETTEAGATGGGDETTEAPTDETITEAPTDETTTEAPKEGETTVAPAKAPSTKAEILGAYNAATAKVAAEKAGYKKNNVTELDDKSMTGSGLLKPLLSLKIGDFSVRQLVGAFMGEDKINYPNGVPTDVKKGTVSDALVKSTLKEADLNSAKAPTCKEEGNNYVITIYVKDELDPKKDIKNGGASALNRFTNDFQTSAEGQKILRDVREAPEGAMDISIEKMSFKYSNAKIVAKIDKTTGKLVNVTHDMDFYARLDGIKVLAFKFKWAEGYGHTNVTYNNFSW